jgi:CubicO group peptidase (beta-lactamase class C family)
MIRRRHAVAAVALLLLPGFVSAQGVFPDRSWPTGTPASVGIGVAVLDSIASEIAAGAYGPVDRMVVIRHGRLVYDGSWAWDYDSIYGDSARTTNALNPHDLNSPYNYFNPWWHPTWRRGDLHTLQSVTKTVTSVIIGVAITRGEFPSIDTPVLQFFDTTKVKNIDARKRRVTIRHLLTMTGGFDWNENLPYIDPANTGVAMEASYDWVQYMIDRPMAREPGTLFNYSSGETELLAHIFFRATGIDIEEYGAKRLFGPLGIERWFWKRTPAGVADTEGGLYLEAKDLARIWHLWLHDGKWNGTQLVSREWVRQSVSPAVRAGNRPGAQSYGFKWWLMPNPTDPSRFIWAGSGFGGQSPMAVPELDLIVVFNGWSILPGMKSLPRSQVMERIIRGTK